MNKINRLLAIPVVTLAGYTLSGQSILTEDFSLGSLAGQHATAVDVYAGNQSGNARWDVARNGADSSPVTDQVAWNVGTGLGWTANDTGGNPYLFADATGTASNTVFSSSGWNTGSAEILTVSFDFAILPENNGDSNNNWGALVMSANAGIGLDASSVPGSSDQQVHVRFAKDGSVAYQDDSLIGSGSEFTTGLNQMNSLTLTYNGSASAYNGITSGNASLSVNGSIVASNIDIGHVSNGDGPVTLDYFEWRSFGGLGDEGGNPYQAYFDNLTITAVPEPSTYVVLTGLLVMGAVFLTRRSRG